MAHNLEIINNEVSFFSHRTVPWHGLGQIVEEAPSAEEAIKLARLDWKVELKPIFSQIGSSFSRIDGQFALQRDIDGKTLGISSDKYTPVQNKEAFGFIDSLIGENSKFDTAGSLSGGKQIFVTVNMGKYKIVDDEIEDYLILTNYHDIKHSIKCAISSTRVVCQNTLSVALNSAKRTWSASHVGTIAGKLFDAEQTLQLANNYRVALLQESENLLKIRIDTEKFIDKLFPIEEDFSTLKVTNLKRDRDELRLRFNAPDISNFKNTAWGAIQVVSDFSTHKVPRFNIGNPSEKLMKETIGGNPLQQLAYDILSA